MINLKNLKSLFVLEGDEKQEKAQKKEPKRENTIKVEDKEQTNTVIPTDTPPPLPSQKPIEETAKTSPTPDAPKPQLDKRYFERLMQSIQDNNMDGFDYLEFKSALKSLDNLPLDEATKFKSAFATSSTMGLTYDTLLGSIDFYKKVMEREKDKFREQLKQQVTKTMVTKQENKDKLEQSIQHKMEQIKRLTDEVNASKEKLGKVESEMNQLIGKIEGVKTNFVATFNHLMKQFDNDLAKIKNYLR
ncbi:MAG: hypothetical protein ACPG5B_09170 [Chitinophagales bacterium]